jgi:hypothetical protein
MLFMMFTHDPDASQSSVYLITHLFFHIKEISCATPFSFLEKKTEGWA